MIFSWRRHRSEPTLAPITRLSAEQALLIARQAINQPMISATMTRATTNKQDGKVIWAISAVLLGRTPLVEVDDTTGAVLSVRWVGLR